MKMNLKRVKKRLKDWDVDIVLITLVILCLLLNAISLLSQNTRSHETHALKTELQSI
ncbi:MAG: hypothetical protein AAF519_07530 [Bacteroidota bacterium]